MKTKIKMIPSSLKLKFSNLVDVKPSLIRDIVNEEFILIDKSKLSSKELERVMTQDYDGVIEIFGKWGLLFTFDSNIIIRLEDGRIFNLNLMPY